MQLRFLAIALPALLLGTAATSPSVTILPDGTYRYVTTIGGRNIGGSTVAARREGAAVVIEQSASPSAITLISARKLEASTFATLSYTDDTGSKHAGVIVLGKDA